MTNVFSARLNGQTSYNTGDSLRYLTATYNPESNFSGLSFSVPYTGMVEVSASAVISGGSVSVKKSGSSSDTKFLFGCPPGNTQNGCGSCLIVCVAGDLLTVIVNNAPTVYNCNGKVVYKMR